MHNPTEEILTEEFKRLIGFIMPMLEEEKVSKEKRQRIKSVIWNCKDAVTDRLINKRENDKSIL